MKCELCKTESNLVQVDDHVLCSCCVQRLINPKGLNLGWHELHQRITMTEAYIGIVKREIARLNKSLKGKYGAVLGELITTPCVECHDGSLRRAFKRIAVPKYLGLRPKGAYMCHKCDNPKCIELTHLFWGSPGDNVRDAILKGRMKPFGRTPKLPFERIKELESKLALWTAELSKLKSKFDGRDISDR